MTLTEIEKASKEEIIAEARSRGYEIIDGRRLGWNGVILGIDRWMNAANRRLYEIRLDEAL